MKKIIALIVSCFMTMAVFALPAFADDYDYAEGVTTSATESTIEPREVVELYRYGPAYLDGTTSAVTITPKADSNLHTIVSTEGTPTIVNLWQNGRLVASVTAPANTSSQNFALYQNCNGGSYQVTITHYSFTAIMVGIFQSDYI